MPSKPVPAPQMGSRRRTVLFACIALSATAGIASAASDDAFAFIHFSDSHLSPYPDALTAPPAVRGADTIAWLADRSGGPQQLTPFNLTTPAPSFGFVTGDITEYGVIDHTWRQFEEVFSPIPYPLYVTPGNHDNTWVAMYHIMRQRHGGENYAFTQHGCVFISLCSATPQEPVPTIDGKTRAWLAETLAQIAPETPIFIAFHHPPYGGGFANPAERDTLIDLVKERNVVLLLYGHGHSAVHRNMDGVDGVMGGATFGRNAGYGVISVQDQRLRIAYRYHLRRANGEAGVDTDWIPLLDKPFDRSATRRLFAIAEPRPDTVITESKLRLTLSDVSADAPLEDVNFTLNGEPITAEPAGDHAYTLQLPDAVDGWRLLTVRAKLGDRTDLRTVSFRADRHPQRVLWRTHRAAAHKGQPLLLDDRVIITGTDGAIAALERTTGRVAWRFETGGEILCTPAIADGLIVFGSGDGHVYAVNHSGVLQWRTRLDAASTAAPKQNLTADQTQNNNQAAAYFGVHAMAQAGTPVYGSPLIADGAIYIGDNAGYFHALDLQTGQPRWRFARATYAIEAAPALLGDLVLFGAWDGYVYAVNRSNGQLAWKQLGPKSSEGKGIRYYGPADCGPVTLDDRAFITDRGYVLASYDAQGAMSTPLATAISAIAPAPDAAAFYARGLDLEGPTDFLVKFAANGDQIWRIDLPAGRFPVPPTAVGDRVYVCSNTGLLSVVNAADGAVLAQYQVTPGFFVMAPVAVDDKGICYVAAMDGTVTALQLASNAVASR